ncbi:hypothetical protein [Coleofasciculus sp.]|uniref:hypothetical protein n=1 Tax=Coleofasciculus sp. TaxID=3100458 RepID=UPI003A450ADC
MSTQFDRVALYSSQLDRFAPLYKERDRFLHLPHLPYLPVSLNDQIKWVTAYAYVGS